MFLCVYVCVCDGEKWRGWGGGHWYVLYTLLRNFQLIKMDSNYTDTAKRMHAGIGQHHQNNPLSILILSSMCNPPSNQAPPYFSWISMLQQNSCASKYLYCLISNIIILLFWVCFLYSVPFCCWGRGWPIFSPIPSEIFDHESCSQILHFAVPNCGFWYKYWTQFHPLCLLLQHTPPHCQVAQCNPPNASLTELHITAAHPTPLPGGTV